MCCMYCFTLISFGSLLWTQRPVLATCVLVVDGKHSSDLFQYFTLTGVHLLHSCCLLVHVTMWLHGVDEWWAEHAKCVTICLEYWQHFHTYLHCSSTAVLMVRSCLSCAYSGTVRIGCIHFQVNLALVFNAHFVLIVSFTFFSTKLSDSLFFVK